MSSYPPRYTTQPPAPAPVAAPHAALLIDFDNVTMGVRSDLGKEMKMLLNSEVFRGKIAVRRAYADWRRYPNYVVPLSESSVDLIFAPAYGTSKKNATDLRMAVDAIELAFMRPEIGTFILLTGDSDFTSCVVKLKEYGKYVIGVGMRESSSDLLIQNCDEYYSYHALSGLTRATTNDAAKEDPWLLVKRAAQQMLAGGDAMRTDRLKQVMIDLDPGFDEKALGYSKFSRFVSEAASKGLIHLKRVENGQYEIVPEQQGAGGPVTLMDVDEPRERERDRDRDRDRGRGRNRDRGRGRFGDRSERYSAPAPAAAASAADTADAAPAFAGAEAAPAAEARPTDAFAPEETAPQTPVHPATGAGTGRVDNLETAYALLQHTVRGVVGGRIGQTVRDGDVKRRMLELAPDFDESALGFSKFSRFLRQAHDAEVIDLRRLGEGSYEVALPASGTKLPPPSLAPAGPRAEGAEPAAAAEAQADGGRRDGGRGRGRGRGRGPRPDGAPALLPGQVVGGVPASGFAEPDVEVPRGADEAPAAPVAGAHPIATEGPARAEEPRRTEAAAPVVAAPAESRPAAEAARVGVRGRRGGRGRGGMPEGPPPLLPGQAVPSSRAVAAPAPAPAEAGLPAETRAVEPDMEAPAAAAEAPAERGDESRGRGRRGRGRGRGDREAAAPLADAAAGAGEATPAAGAPPAVAEAASAAPAGTDPLGLPTSAEEVERYITTAYRGVGRATARMLTQTFGENVFAAMREDPDSVRSLLGRRAESLLDQWSEDYARRTAERGTAAPAKAAASAAAPEAPAAEAPAQTELPVATGTVEPDVEAPAATAAPDVEDEGPRGRGRGRRGRGRGRGRTDGDAAAAAAEAPADAAPAAVEPAPEPVAEAPAVDAPAAEATGGDAAEAAPRKRSRGRGRGRAGDAEAAAPAEPAAEAPAPASEPTAPASAPEQPAAGRAPRKSRARPRAEAATEAPAATDAPAAPAAEADAPAGEGDAGDARPRSRRGGRGRGRGRNGGAAAE